jgi:manganese transport protein
MGPTIVHTRPKGASLTERTVSAARSVLAGQRGGVRGYQAFAGPAVIASIAYMDTGCCGWCCSPT